MKLAPTKLGAEPKKLAVLAVLLVVAGYFYFTSQGSGESASSPARPGGSATATPSGVDQRSARPAAVRLRPGERGLNSAPREFRPSMKAKDVDPSGIDPTLHLELLAKLKAVGVDHEGRSLFELSATPPPDPTKIKEPDKIVPKMMVGPQPPSPPPPPPPEPKAPPIPLKFYGFVNQNKAGDKRAFFLDGEDIVIATEGDMIKKRYKIIRIGVNSAVVEDTVFKGTNTEQTLPLEKEMAG